MSGYDEVAVITALSAQSGPGSASLAASWASYFGLTNVQVWGDTTNHMYWTFTSNVGGQYPSTIVVELDTMTIRSFDLGGVAGATSVVNQILADDHPCGE